MYNNTFKHLCKDILFNIKNDSAVSLSLLPTYIFYSYDLNKYLQLIDYIVFIKEKYNIDDTKIVLSFKILQFGKNFEERYKNIEKLVKYSNNNNIFAWIACLLYKNQDEEIKMYTLLKKQNLNIGITLSAYRDNISTVVDNILKLDGTIRLVKGYYNDYSKNIDIINKDFIENACKLIESKKSHCIVTHDFKIINYLNNKYNILDNIEFAFFNSNNKYCYNNIELYNLDIKKSFYIPHGNVFIFIITNILFIDFKYIKFTVYIYLLKLFSFFDIS